MNASTPTLRSLESIGIMCAALFLFSMADLLQKYLGAQGFPVTILVLYPAAISACLATVSIFIIKGPKGFIPVKPIKLHMIRVFCTILGAYAIVTALQLIPIAQFYGIVFSIPFLVAVGAVFIFKEHPGWARWLAIAGGFTGVWIAANPDFSNINPGIIAAIVAAFCISGANLTVRKIGPGEFTPLYPLYAHLGIITVSLFLVPELEPVTFHQGFLFMLTGVSLFFAVILITTAFIIAPLAAIVAPFQYTQILWGVIGAYIIFGEFPDTRTQIGIAIIIICGLFLIWREYKAHKISRTPKGYTRA